MRWCIWILASFLVIVSYEPDTLASKVLKENSSLLPLVLVDSRGKAVAGVKVGTKVTHKEGRLWWNIGRENTSAISDDNGKVYLNGSKLFRSNYDDDYTITIYAFDEEIELVGLKQVSRVDLGRELKIEMVDPCRIHGEVDSSELRKLGYRITQKSVWISNNTPDSSEFIQCSYNQHRYDRDNFVFFVPPGNYKVRCWVNSNLSGIDTQKYEQLIEVKSEKKELDLGVIDLSANKFAKMTGKLAPELQNIREWKNSHPVKLAELRGRLVLLHFWKYSCEKNWPAIHHLITLYKASKDEGLDVEVIVIHEGSLNSLAEMEVKFSTDTKLAKVMEEKWGGKSLPLRVALDSKEPIRYTGAETYIRGINWANYYITSYPKTLLIDKSGVLRQELNVFDSDDIKAALARLKTLSQYQVGSHLNKLDDFDIELSSDNVRNKMILVCFFDMNQRPSRYCTRQLGKKAQELKTKDIVIVAIQASRVDEDEINEWVTKNNIPFPVGIVEGDDEKTRFAWGVRSLPWLILTDKNHIVQAEGFSLNELGRKTQKPLETKK